MLTDEEHALLVRASRDGQRVVVQGVGISLAHELLDRGVWQPAIQLGINHPLGGGPSLVLPWTPPEYVRWMELSGTGDVITVRTGDRVLVSHVRSVSTGSAYEDDDHPHNREMRVAHLFLWRADGSDADAGVVLFHGVQSTVRPGAAGDENERIAEALFSRLAGRCGFDPRDYIGDEPEDWPSIPSQLTQAERHALLSLLEHGGDATVGFGYWMARAEAEAGIAVRATKLRRRTAKAASDAQPRARANKADADARWRELTLGLANRLRMKDPAIGSQPLVDALLLSDEAPEAIPQPDTLKKAIRAWEKAGLLPRSTQNPARRGGA